MSYKTVLESIPTHLLTNTNKINDAKEWCGSKTTTGIVNCCTGKYSTSGKHPKTGEKLRWIYYEDYIKEFDKSTLTPYRVGA